jgi:hypothetical protein
VRKHIDIASLSTNIPTLCQWIVLLLRMLIRKDRSKFFALIVIAILMVTA